MCALPPPRKGARGSVYLQPGNNRAASDALSLSLSLSLCRTRRFSRWLRQQSYTWRGARLMIGRRLNRVTGGEGVHTRVRFELTRSRNKVPGTYKRGSCGPRPSRGGIPAREREREREREPLTLLDRERMIPRSMSRRSARAWRTSKSLIGRISRDRVVGLRRRESSRGHASRQIISSFYTLARFHETRHGSNIGPSADSERQREPSLSR